MLNLEHSWPSENLGICNSTNTWPLLRQGEVIYLSARTKLWRQDCVAHHLPLSLMHHAIFLPAQAGWLFFLYIPIAFKTLTTFLCKWVSFWFCQSHWSLSSEGPKSHFIHVYFSQDLTLCGKYLINVYYLWSVNLLHHSVKMIFLKHNLNTLGSCFNNL